MFPCIGKMVVTLYISDLPPVQRCDRKLGVHWTCVFCRIELDLEQTEERVKHLNMLCSVVLPQDAYSEVASLFAEFFRDLDIVPSDIIAGLVLLRQRQRAKRSAILDQVQARAGKIHTLNAWESKFTCVSVPQGNNDILAFLSGMPVTRSTRYLDLKNSVRARMWNPVPVVKCVYVCVTALSVHHSCRRRWPCIRRCVITCCLPWRRMAGPCTCWGTRPVASAGCSAPARKSRFTEQGFLKLPRVTNRVCRATSEYPLWLRSFILKINVRNVNVEECECFFLRQATFKLIVCYFRSVVLRNSGFCI